MRHDRGVQSSVHPSGVLGAAGRVSSQETGPPRSSLLSLAGRPLPLVAQARIYTCGITPYDVTHLGHAATFVWADLLASVVRMAGVSAATCRNVTDIDDVLTVAASGRGRPYDEFALTQEFLFDRDMTALSVARPQHTPHARAHVQHVVQLAGALLRTGDAYERDGHVFFRGAGLPARHGLDEAAATALTQEFSDPPTERDPIHADSPDDVAVWRPSPPDHPAWPSPWGWGRPGWHAECAAMAWAVFGGGVDVLVGGADLAYPHHAFQAAMVEASGQGGPFARRTLHVGTVRHDGTKMAKSTQNLVLVGDLLTRASGAAIRLMLLHRPWHAAWDYTDAELTGAAATLEELYAAAGRHTDSAAAAEAVQTALLEDLDVPRAVGVALEAGGLAARSVVGLLKLSDTPT